MPTTTITPTDKLLSLLHSPNTVTSELAKDPSRAVFDVAEGLYGSTEPSKLDKILDKLHLKSSSSKGEVEEQVEFTKEVLDRVAEGGKFKGQRPGDLFLKIFHDVLATLEADPMAGLVSPSLLASTGVIPLSIVSVIPDIIKHYADVIVRAETEIFFATNFWEASGAAKTICEALVELSRRVGERGGPKIVVKMMYDRGNPKQAIEPHQFVDVETYTSSKVKLPSPEEIPNLSLEVINYHKPPVGTFHAKYLVVDRKIVLLNSNNIQDRVNVEMMSHIEGDIVQGFYDMALLSWNNALHPPLPLLTSPPPPQTHFDFGSDHPHISAKDLSSEANEDSKKVLHQQLGVKSDATSSSRVEDGKFDEDNWKEAQRVQEGVKSGEDLNAHLNTGTKISSTEPFDSTAKAFRPHVVHSPHQPVPMCLVNRRPHGRPGHGDTNNPQDAAWLAGFKYAKKSVFIQTPTFNATPVVAATLKAVRRGVEVTIFADLGFNDEGELLPYQGGTNEMVALSMYKELQSDEEKSRLRIHWYTGKDQRTPLTATKKSRNCHVKLAIFDGEVGMQGNGNQDTQSWFHSQEINVLVDSALICSEWFDAILSNQNTMQHGKLDLDGVWRDPKDGSTLEGAGHIPEGPFKSLAGVKGAIERVRGEGGFET